MSTGLVAEALALVNNPIMRLTLRCQHLDQHDYWAEPGTTWQDLMTQVASQCLAHPWFVGQAQLSGGSVLGLAPLANGCLVSDRPDPVQAPAPGTWCLVALGGIHAGLRTRASPGTMVAPPGQETGPVELVGGDQGLYWQRRAAGQVSTGRVRQNRGRLQVRWRRLGQRRRPIERGQLVRVVDSVWLLDKAPSGQSCPVSTETGQGGPGPAWPQPSPGRAAGGQLAPRPAGSALGGGRQFGSRRAWLAPALTAVIMGGLMLALTRNPLWALMPLAGGLTASFGAIKGASRKPVWTEQVEGLAQNRYLAPGHNLAVHGPAVAAMAVIRAWAGGQSRLAVPKSKRWQWARFCSLETAGEGQATVIGQEDDHFTWQSGPGDGRPVHVAVRPAGLGLVAMRVDGAAPVLVAGIGPGTAERLSRQAAGLNQPATTTYPAKTVLAPDLADRWRRDEPCLDLGHLATGGAFRLHLARDGPHILVAGATGSGKSEFLRSLMLGAATAMSPDRLVIVGIDHKGGATFADLTGLPHLVGLVTDLDTAASRRALTSLEAELLRRERLLDQAGAAKMAQLPTELRPPRLMVVVDEFRTLIETIPSAGAALERLAAQGRSLDMFLVLATQRPAGAVSAQLRANLPLRICFRVATEADSLDVLGDTRAMSIDPAAPGSAVLASAGRPAIHFRAALPGGHPARPAAAITWPDRWTTPPRPAGPGATRLVKQIKQAAEAASLSPQAAPWLPPLPALIGTSQLDDLANAVGPADPANRTDSVPVGLADLPAHQHQGSLRLSPADGHLAILGAPRTGRTTAAVTVAAATLAAGWQTHLITDNATRFAALRYNPALGSVVAPNGPAITSWLDSLAPAPDSRPQVVVLDGVEALADQITPGAERPPLDSLTGLKDGWWVVVTGPAKPSRYLNGFPQRLVLPTIDAAEDLALGLDRQFAGQRSTPGRCVYTRPGQAAEVQLACLDSPVKTTAAGPGPPPRLLSPPSRVSLADLPPPNRRRLWWGLGGPLGLPVALDLVPGRPVAILGPPGSGRSTVLAALAAQAKLAGLKAVTAVGLDPWPQTLKALESGAVVLADNLDQAEDMPPVLPRRGILIGALTATMAASFRGPASLFQAHPTGLVLWPSLPGAAAALGLKLITDTATQQRVPGRGLVVQLSRFTTVQAATSALPGALANVT
ncbi:MAG: FtsK/SpoIIIE domain-containing protein [Micrococcales bacterium]|nr:FtsK/SpoIIIE domain-containing protein [Micrococcales bacterium]